MTVMNTTSDVIARIRGFAEDRRLTKSALAGMAGLNDKTLKNFWDDCWNPTRKTMIALERLIPVDFQVAANDPVSDLEEAA
jgi:DNA-binding XRE family transcriptional regulator